MGPKKRLRCLSLGFSLMARVPWAMGACAGTRHTGHLGDPIRAQVAPEQGEHLKRTGYRYRAERLAGTYDVIVIGSGIGGLCAAALLSKLGQRVCVLEQHYTAGGFTHSYARKGFEWDVGVHYIGEVHKPHSLMRRLFDLITDQQLQWAPMDPVYDRIKVGQRVVDFPAGRQALAQSLKQHFPHEHEAIDAYLELVVQVARSVSRFFAGQAMPRPLARLWMSTRAALLPKACFQAVREVLEGLTNDQELIAVLCGQWGDYGVVPSQASFLMHATVVKHYLDGSNYPVGGSWRIAQTIIPVIQAAGGEVFTYARVQRIEVDRGRAVGVQMADGTLIRAAKVISAVGARLTYERLLPQTLPVVQKTAARISRIQPSAGHLCLYAGFKGNAQSLKLPRTNLWIYPSSNVEEHVRQFEQDLSAPFPLLYISFPSAKDPQWDSSHPDTATVEVLTLGAWKHFAPWADKRWRKRGADYDALKAGLQHRLLEALFAELPQLRAALVYAELSTPLSTRWFSQYASGEIYGMDHTPERFAQHSLHPITPIKGLYLSGQDVLTAGVGGAMMGGLVTTCAMLGPKAASVMRLLKPAPKA